jgi:hypothetical protein
VLYVHERVSEDGDTIVCRLFDLSSDLEKPEQKFYLQPIITGKCQNASAIYPVEFSYGSEEFELVDQALFTDHFSSLQDSDWHWPSDVNRIILIMPGLDIAMVLVIAIGSMGIIFEESLAFNKGGVVLLMAVCLWVIRNIRAPSSHVVVQEPNHTTIEVSEIVFSCSQQ